MQLIRHLLGGLLGLASTALIVLPVAAAMSTSADRDTPHGSVTAALARDLTTPAAVVPERCHGTGALIRTRGRIRQVSLARGLRSYQHAARGRFVSLCLDATPQAP